MFALFWNLSAAAWPRTPQGLKWAVPVALVAAPVYLFAMRISTSVVEHGGPGYLNVLVLLFAWNAIKFACTAVIAPIWMLRSLASRARAGNLDASSH